MKLRLSILLALVCHIAAADATADMPVVRRIADLNAAANAADGKTVRFDITARITQPGIPGKRSFVAEDETGAARFGTNQSISHLCPTNAGDVVHIRGATTHSLSRARKFENDATEIELVRHGTRPAPIPISGHELYDRKDVFQRLVSIKGTVHDAFRDEIDLPWSFIDLKGSVYAELLLTPKPRVPCAKSCSAATATWASAAMSALCTPAPSADSGTMPEPESTKQNANV